MERIYHTWDRWECYRAGFFEVNPPEDMTREEAEEVYRAFLADIPEFKRVLARVISEWKCSCEHNLSNENHNRIAWLGQAALAYKYGIPSAFRGGFHRLSEEQQSAANDAALEALNMWVAANTRDMPLTHETAKSKTQMNLY